MSEDQKVVLNPEMSLNMFYESVLSIAVIDENFNMIYMNEKAEEFYNKAFHAKNLLGKNIESCHQPANIENMKKLMEKFKEKSIPFAFKSVEIPFIEGGHMTVLWVPYFSGGIFKGLMEIPVESSLTEGGRGEYQK